METVRGKSAIVFGGLGGIAKAFNNLFLENRIKNLLLIDIQEDSQNYVSELQIKFINSKIFFEHCDITKKEFVASIFDKYHKKFGYIDILVNSAGIMNEHDIELTYQINILGPINTCLEALNYMGKHKGGQGGIIVNVSSIAGLGPVGGYCPIYASTKYALLGFSRCLMEDIPFEMSGVRTIVLCPGATITEMVQSAGEKIIHFPEEAEKFQKILENTKVQCSEDVANALEIALIDGSNGVWMVNEGKTGKLDFQKYFETPQI